MRTPFVADCSVAIGWIHPAQSNHLTAYLLEAAIDGASVHVPTLWFWEVANALLTATKRKLITQEQREKGLVLLSNLRVIADDEGSRTAFSVIPNLAEKYMLSAYDAAYLELARRKSLPLATRDAAMISAAKKAGIKTL